MTPLSLILPNSLKRISSPTILLLFSTLWASLGCTSKHVHKTSSTSKSDSTLIVLDDTARTANLVTLVSPQNTPYRTGGVYIDSVRKVVHNHKASLLIYGNLPSGCSNLLGIDHHAKGDTLHLHMTSWKPKDKMCTQQLVPFTYLYSTDMTITDLEKMQFCNVNGQMLPLKP